jgi:hypothetical protein
MRLDTNLIDLLAQPRCLTDEERRALTDAHDELLRVLGYLKR